MEALNALDDVAYVRFASVYRNFREAKDFENFIIDELSAEEEQRLTGPPCSMRDRRWRWRGAGSALWPNPSVGCVIVRDG